MSRGDINWCLLLPHHDGVPGPQWMMMVGLEALFKNSDLLVY